MAKNLLIVESPAKTKTLKKFLGRTTPSRPRSGTSATSSRRTWGSAPTTSPATRSSPPRRMSSRSCAQAAKEAETVYLAPDPDREGEAIAWHIAEVLARTPRTSRRVTFNEITKGAVLKALEHPGDDRPAEGGRPAGPARARPHVGFRLSPLLWEKVKQGLSAGRVQSVALKMICDRQARDRAFVPRSTGTSAPTSRPAPPPAVRRPPQPHRRQEGRGAATASEAARIVADLEKGRVRGRQGRAQGARQQRRRRRSSPAACSRRRRGARLLGQAHHGHRPGALRRHESATAARSASSPTCVPTRPASPTTRSQAAAS